MKFSEFINEQYITSTKELISDGLIPLTSTMMDRLGYTYNGTVYHATDIKGLNNLVKLQGTKKQISAFTKGGTNLMSKIVISPKYIVQLNADIQLEAEQDMWTSLDKKGRRWVRLIKYHSKEGDRLHDIIIGNVVSYLLKNNFISEDDYDNLPDANRMKEFISWIESSKDRNKFYKWYFDMIERTLEKNYQLLNKHLKNTSQSINYNEVVANNIKIEGAYIVDDLLTQEQLKTLNIKYLGFLKQTDFDKLK